MEYSVYLYNCQRQVLLAVSTLGLCALLVCLRKRQTMSKKKDGSSVDPGDHKLENYHGSKQVLEKIEVNVEIINGECCVENGDEKLTAKCNAVLAEMSAFQRAFLSIGPEGKPSKVVFMELILKDMNDGSVQTKACFQRQKPEEKIDRLNQLRKWAKHNLKLKILKPSE